MSDDIRVSLIMPVYNTDKILLKTCVESITRQTSDRWNLLIVDDGSGADVAEFCDQFTADARIKVVHQKNTGVSVARNNGTAMAENDYVMYVDADDVLADFVVEEALCLAEKTNADIVFGGVCKIRSQADFANYDSLRQEGESDHDFTKDEFTKRILGGKVKGLNDIQGRGYVGRGPWAKMIKRAIASQVPFPEGFPIGEDLIWSLRVLNRCRTCVVAQSIWYGYVLYASSAISKYYGNREEIVTRWLEIIKEENASFFDRHHGVEGHLLAKELYCIIQYDILSTQNKMGMSKKNKAVREMLCREPWNQLKNKAYQTDLSSGQKVLLAFCASNLGATAAAIYIKMKALKAHK